MNEFESSNHNQERTPDADEFKWDHLKDAPHPLFNKVEKAEQVDDQVERRLRNDLLDAGEQFSKNERSAYGYLSEEMTKSNLGIPSSSVEGLGINSAMIDSKRLNTMIEYLDTKYSTDIKEEDKQKILNDLRESYLKDTKNRVGLFEDTTGSIARDLNQSENKTFEEPAYRVNSINKIVPDQMSIANAYFEYFDHPTEEAKKRLNNQVDNYALAIRQGVGKLSETVYDNRVGSSDLADILNNNVGRGVSLSYEDVHSALMQYFNHKLEKATPIPEKVEDVPRQTPPAPKSSQSLPSDIF